MSVPGAGDLVSPERDLVSVERDLVSVERDVVTAERDVRCMGGSAHLIVRAAPRVARSALAAGRARLHALDRRWSRFRPDSELSRLGRAGGARTAVHPDTWLLVSWCVVAWQRSGGRFDPTVLAALEELGYGGTAPATGAPAHSRVPGCAGVVAHPDGTVSVPGGVRLDPGGIGKGLAADRAAEAMMAAGAAGACVNVAGDVCARGDGPDHGDWIIGVEHPLQAGGALALLRLPPGGGAVASSSVLVRRWGADRHHIVDPVRGLCSASPVVAATVVADQGAWADAATKIALVEPDPDVAVRLLDDLDLAAVLVLATDDIRTTRAFRARHGTGA